MSVKKILAGSIISVAALGGLGACVAGGSDDPGANKQPGVSQGAGSKSAASDVKGSEMSTPYGTVEIPVKVTNHTSKASDYNIEATVYDAQGNQVATASTFIQRVQPGHTAKDRLIAVDGGAKADHYKITLVERTASL